MQVRVIIEYSETGATLPAARWERVGMSQGMRAGSTAAAGAGIGTFELLGRAFEAAQREEDVVFGAALAAFFRGAMIGKEDLAEVLTHLDGQAGA